MDALVTTEWLEKELGASDLRIVDATKLAADLGRNAREEYEAGHIPHTLSILSAGGVFSGDMLFRLALILVVSLLAERLLRGPVEATPLGDLDVRGWARGLLAHWPPPGDGTRPGRLHAAIVRGRLSRFADGKSPPMPALLVALAAWRAARA